MTKEIIIEDLEHIKQAAQEFIATVGNNRLFALEGNMGAGKTTFVKAVCDCLGVEDNVCSPTFAILNVYYSKTEGEVYHFDFYRLISEEQAMDIGIEENLYSQQWCFMEWAENIKNLIPKHCIRVRLQEIENHKRKISIEL